MPRNDFTTIYKTQGISEVVPAKRLYGQSILKQYELIRSQLRLLKRCLEYFQYFGG